MSRLRAAVSFLLPAVALCSSTACTLNIYWTDNIVYGELRQGSDLASKREPIPLELKVRP
jgi:hypothetical protein